MGVNDNSPGDFSSGLLSARVGAVDKILNIS